MQDHILLENISLLTIRYTSNVGAYVVSLAMSGMNLRIVEEAESNR